MHVITLSRTRFTYNKTCFKYLKQMLAKRLWNNPEMVKLSHTSSWSQLGSSVLDPGWGEVPQEGSDFTLSREQTCVSLSINTWRLDWTHLESLAVNEREPEVRRLYRPSIIWLGGTRRDPPQHQLSHARHQLLTSHRLIWADCDPGSDLLLQLLIYR